MSFVWQRALGLALMAAVAIAAPAARAEEPAAPAVGDYDLGWHIVRPGENLHYIARKYAGDQLRWSEISKLNPQIQDPNVLAPGERIRVLVERRRSVPTARLRSLAGEVEEKPAPISWNPAREEDLLLEEDGLRTGSRASTEMEFQDGTRVVMTEESLVYLRREGRRLTGVPPKAVEIVEGQAEVATRQPPGSEQAIEILVGGTRALSRPDASGVSQTRARRGGDDTAKVMVYEGGGEVESGGRKVEVARGMGTSVEQGRPPATPEKLLPPPTGLVPEPGAALTFNDLVLSWQAVAGAASYTVELCRDPDCALLVERRVGLAQPSWRPEAPPLGEYYWRATAVSASGLDGYPSPGAALAILGGPDRTPPSGSLTVSGPQIRFGRRHVVDETVQLEPQLEDAHSGVAGWRPVIDGEEVTIERWRGPWPDGTFRVSVLATDRVGNEGRVGEREIVVDALAPELRVTAEPPAAAGAEPELSRQESCSWLQRSRWSWLSWAQCRYLRRAPRRWLKRGWSWLEVSSDQRTWNPFLLPGSPVYRDVTRRRHKLPQPSSEVVVRGDLPQLFLRAAGGRPLAPAAGAPGAVLRVRAVDAGAGVEWLELEIGQAEGGVRLRAAASDVFGHRRELGWRP